MWSPLSSFFAKAVLQNFGSTYNGRQYGADMYTMYLQWYIGIWVTISYVLSTTLLKITFIKAEEHEQDLLACFSKNQQPHHKDRRSLQRKSTYRTNIEPQ